MKTLPDSHQCSHSQSTTVKASSPSTVNGFAYISGKLFKVKVNEVRDKLNLL
jgi:hypothetical protein